MNIFEALRESHEQQRNLAERLIQTSGHTQEREDLFKKLKNELYAHSVAEDRYLYIPLMFDDVGLDITRHALAEHHEMDELVEKLEETDMSNPSWLATAKQLSGLLISVASLSSFLFVFYRSIFYMHRHCPKSATS